MLFVIALLAALAFFLFLTLGVAKDPQKRKYFYLYLLVDIWLTSVFIYLIYEAVID
ncbi:MAG: hypothetical protein IIB69_04185 [Proteobacteria bacterium]|nr:hypothetical protein [Pseudomonadota bacterium]